MFYKQNDTAAAPPAPTRSGWIFDQWYTDPELKNAADFGSIKNSCTLYAGWTEANASYTVIHWQENAVQNTPGKTEYSHKESERLNGTTGGTTAAAAKTYEGFTAQTIEQKTIAGDGSTVVNVYYDRNVYKVQFYEYSHRQWTEIVEKRITAKYGTYIGDKWPGGRWKTEANGTVGQLNIDVMPLGGDEFFESSQGGGSADYYLEDLNGKYVWHHTDTGAGTSSNVTKEDRYPITGFTCNLKKSPKDGKSYNGAKFYYDRNSYNVVYMSNGEKIHEQGYKYEAGIDAAGKYEPATAPTGKEGYIFEGWYADPSCTKPFDFTGKTMPAQDVTVYAKWTAPIHIVTVYAPDKTIVLQTISDIGHGYKISEDDIKKYIPAQGYEFLGWMDMDTNKPFSFDTEIRKDYNLYALVRALDKHKVTYDLNGGKGTVPTDNTEYAEGAKAKILPGDTLEPPADNMVFLGWSTAKDATAAEYVPGSEMTMGTENVTLYAIWGEKEQTVSLTYHANYGEDATETRTEILNNDLVKIAGNLFPRDGYTFKGWSTARDGAAQFNEGDEARVNKDGTNDLYAVWKANTDTLYKVEFYYDGKLDHTDTRTGVTDTIVSVSAADKADKENGKYTLDTSAANVYQDKLAGNGTTVLKLYFKLNTATFTIHHYLLGTKVPVADDQNGIQTIGTKLSASAAAKDKLYADYKDATATEESLAQTITISTSGNVITVYYTVPLTLTAKSAEKVYNGTEPVSYTHLTLPTILRV